MRALLCLVLLLSPLTSLVRDPIVDPLSEITLHAGSMISFTAVHETSGVYYELHAERPFTATVTFDADIDPDLLIRQVRPDRGTCSIDDQHVHCEAPISIYAPLGIAISAYQRNDDDTCGVLRSHGETTDWFGILVTATAEFDTERTCITSTAQTIYLPITTR